MPASPSFPPSPVPPPDASLPSKKGVSPDALSTESAALAGGALAEMVEAGGLPLLSYQWELGWRRLDGGRHLLWGLPLVVGLGSIPLGTMLLGHPSAAGVWRGSSLIRTHLFDFWMVLLLAYLPGAVRGERGGSLGHFLGRARGLFLPGFALSFLVARAQDLLWMGLVHTSLLGLLLSTIGSVGFQALSILIFLGFLWVRFHLFSALVREGRGFTGALSCGLARALGEGMRLPAALPGLFTRGNQGGGVGRLRVLLLSAAGLGMLGQLVFLGMVWAGFPLTSMTESLGLGEILFLALGPLASSMAGLVVISWGVTRWGMLDMVEAAPVAPALGEEASS